MESDVVKVESVERRDSTCCYARRRRERLTDAWKALLSWRRHVAISSDFARAMCRQKLPRLFRQPLSFPQAEKRNGNTVLSLKPTDATKRSQTECSETD